MADDVAELGLQINSTSVKDAGEDLRNFESVARRTGETVEQVRDRFKRLADEANKLAPAERLVGTEAARAAKEMQAATGIAAGYQKGLSDLRNQMISAAAGLGLLGAAMTTAGGPFLIAAIAIKAVADALSFVRNVASEAGQKAQDLKQLSEATNLTINELRALKKIGGEFGVGGDQIETWLQRAAISTAGAREGTGQLIEALNKIDPVFSRQIQQASTMAERLDILSAAAAQAKKQGQDVAVFWRDIFGRGSSRADPVFAAIALAGGLDQANQSMKNFAGTTSEEIEQRARLTRELEVLNAKYKAMEAALLGATTVLEAEAIVARTRNAAMEHTLKLRNDFLSKQDETLKAYGDEKRAINEVAEAEAARSNAAARINRGVRSRSNDAFSNLTPPDEAGFQPPKATGGSFTDEAGFRAMAESAGAAQLKINQAFNAMSKWMGVLGGAATIQEQSQLSLAKMNKEFANQEHGLETGTEKMKERITASIRLNEVSQLASLRLGVLGQTASVEDTLNQKLLDRQKAIQQGAHFSEDEIKNLDRVNKAVANGTLQMQAAADASRIEIAILGMSTGAATAYRLQMEKVNEAKRNGQSVSAETRAEWAKEAEAAGKVAAALEKAKVAADIKRERSMVFLSADDVQIANQLKNIYPDVATAIGSAEASQIRFTNAMKEAKDIGTEFIKTMLKGLMDQKAGTDGLSNAFKALSMKLADKAIEQLLSGDFEKAAVSAISAVVTWIASLISHTNDLKHTIDVLDRLNQLRLRMIQATSDTSTLAGQLNVFNAQALLEQVEEMRKGGELLGALLQVQAAERLKIEQDFQKQAAEQEKQANEERLRAQEEILNRQKSFQDRLFSATNDNSTLQGQLAAFDRAAEAERVAEIKAGGQAMVDLEAAQAAERFNVVKNFNEQAIEESKRAAQEQLDIQTRAAKGIVDYINNLKVGPDTNLSPSARLAAAQQTYNSILSLAQGGNVNALARITQDFENFRKAAQDFYGSGSGYQNILNSGIAQLQGLPAVATSSDPVVQAVLGTTAAVEATRTAVLADTTATVAKLDLSIIKLQDVVNQLATTVGRLDNTNAILNAMNSFTSRIVNAINALGATTASIGNITNINLADINSYTKWIALFAASDHGQGQPPGGGGGGLFGWAGFEKGGLLGSGQFGIMGEHHPAGPFIIKAGSSPVPISPNMPSGLDGASVRELVNQLMVFRAESRQDAANINQSVRGVGRDVKDNTGDRRDQSAQERQEMRIQKRKRA